VTCCPTAGRAAVRPGHRPGADRVGILRQRLADVDPSQREALVKTGLLGTVGEDRVVWRDPVLGAAAAEASRRGEALISGQPS